MHFDALLPWLLASLGLAIVMPSLAWLAARGPLAGLAAWPGTPPVAWFLVALYLLLPPLGALNSGVLSPYYMGLVENDWLMVVGVGGGLAVLITGLTLAGWLVYRHTLPQGPFVDSEGSRPGPGERWSAALTAPLWQWHWTFYRAAAITWLAAGATLPAAFAELVPFLAPLQSAAAAAVQAQPIYWGSWLGLLLAGLEWVLNPYTWSALRTAGRVDGAVRAAGLAIATTGLFALTRSFWLCLACSVIVEVAVAGWFSLPRTEPARPPGA